MIEKNKKDTHSQMCFPFLKIQYLIINSLLLNLYQKMNKTGNYHSFLVIIILIRDN